ncbi:MAG: lysostaphin resistance A-like protein [Filifactoraceae bacterium]
MNKILSWNETIKEADRVSSVNWGYILGLVVFIGVNYRYLLKDVEINSILLSLCMGIVSISVFVICVIKVSKRTLKSLGMENKNILKRMLFGWLIAAICLLIIWGINIAFNGITFKLNKEIKILAFLIMFIGFIFQGFTEEFIFRGLIQTKVSIKFGVVTGLFVNSIIFSLLHLAYDGSSFISTINTFMIGLVFSMMFYYHDNLWLVSGFHSGWNFILGPILGVNVSGINLPTSLIITELIMGKEYLNGGIYGFEASFLVSILTCILVIIYIVLILKSKKDNSTQFGLESIGKDEI